MEIVVHIVTVGLTHVVPLPPGLLTPSLCLSGGGEADPPHAVRAVHRVPGGPPGSAAQQQRGASGGGGAARLHPGPHQAAGLLLQVLTNLPLLLKDPYCAKLKVF